MPQTEMLKKWMLKRQQYLYSRKFGTIQELVDRFGLPLKVRQYWEKSDSFGPVMEILRYSIFTDIDETATFLRS